MLTTLAGICGRMDHGEESQGQHNETSITYRMSGRHICQLPMTRIKTIIKSDPDINLISQDAALLIAKATELFIGFVARKSHVFTVRGKRKTIQKRDIDACLPQHDELAFLEGTID